MQTYQIEQAEGIRAAGQKEFVRGLIQKIRDRAGRSDNCRKFISRLLVAFFWHLDCGILPPHPHLEGATFFLGGILKEVGGFCRHQAEKEFLLATLAKELADESLMVSVRDYHQLVTESPNEFFAPELGKLEKLQGKLSLADR